MALSVRPDWMALPSRGPGLLQGEAWTPFWFVSSARPTDSSPFWVGLSVRGRKGAQMNWFAVSRRAVLGSSV